MCGGTEGGEVEVMVAARSGSAARARSFGRGAACRGREGERLSSHLSMRGVASLTDGRMARERESPERAITSEFD